MARPKSKEFELCPEGQQNLECIGIVDIGTQKVTFEGKEKDVPQIVFVFQAVDEKTSDGGAMTVMQTYTNSDSPKGNLFKMLCAWFNVKEIPANFEYDQCLGRGGVGTVAWNDKKSWAKLVNLASLPKGYKIAKATEKKFSFYLDEFDEEAFNNLSDYFKGKIMESKEAAELFAPQEPKAKATTKAPAKVAAPAKGKTPTKKGK